MLKLRVMTAVVLLAVLLIALWAPTVWPLLILLSVIAGCAFWEWLRLTLTASMSTVAVAAASILTVVLITIGSQIIMSPSHSHVVTTVTLLRQVLVPAVAVLGDWRDGSGITGKYPDTASSRCFKCFWCRSSDCFVVLPVAVIYCLRCMVFGVHDGADLVCRQYGIFYRESIGQAQACASHQPRKNLGRCCRGYCGCRALDVVQCAMGQQFFCCVDAALGAGINVAYICFPCIPIHCGRSV